MRDAINTTNQSREMQQAEQEEKLCSQLCKKIADLVKVVDKLFRNSHTAQLENVFLREELVELEALRKDNEQWKEKCDKLQAKLREEEERHKNECEKLQEMHKVEIDKLREEMNHREQVLVDKLQEKDHALADMEHQLGVKTVQGKELQASLSEYMKRYKAASTSRREAKAENDGLFSELVAVKSSMESMEEELDAVRAERDGLKRELEQQWEIERSGWEGEKRKLHEEISSLSDQVKKLQGQLLKMSHDSQEALLPLRGEGAQSSLRHSARKSQVDSSGSVLVSTDGFCMF